MFPIFNSFVVMSAQELVDIDNRINDLKTQVDDADFKLMEKTQGGAKIQWDNWNNSQLEDLLEELKQVIETRKKQNQKNCIENLQLALKNTIDAFSDNEDFKAILEEYRKKMMNGVDKTHIV
jgi:hypothetical protein